MSNVTKKKVFPFFRSTISHKYISSVGKHLLANLKVWGAVRQISVFVFLYEFTRVFTQKSQLKTQVQNMRGTREMELTESQA